MELGFFFFSIQARRPLGLDLMINLGSQNVYLNTYFYHSSSNYHANISDQRFFEKKPTNIHFFLSVTWHLNQVSILVSWSKNGFFENHQFWKSPVFLKLKLEKMSKNWFFMKKFPKIKKCIIFLSGEDIKIGEVYKHFFLSMWCSLTLQIGSVLVLLQVVFMV